MHDFLRELFVGVAAVVMFISPCLLASRCGSATERRHADKPFDGVERRAPR